MLIQFTVGNFKSIKDKVTLSLEATNDDWLEEENVAKAGNRRLVKSAAIYGANASGKSNFLTAMAVFNGLIISSSKDSQKGDVIPVVPFKLNTATEAAPTFFEIVLLQKDVRYRYGFEATQDQIVSEWLFSQGNSTRETTLFTRENGIIETSESFKEGKGYEKSTRSNALFLSVVAQWNGTIAGEILNWMSQFRCILGLDDAAYMGITASLLSHSTYGPIIQEIVRRADIGIEKLEAEDITAERIPNQVPSQLTDVFRELIVNKTANGIKPFAMKTMHKRFGPDGKPSGVVEFNLKTNGSAGTQKFVAMAGPFLRTLHEGAVLFVDELEARLHPLLTKALVALFNSSANRQNAQLIFATHDEGLLDSRHIRRDQVWFVEKDEFQSSKLYCLDEFKGVRKEAKLAKEYMMGEFGGVPKLGDLQGVINHVE